MSLCGSWVHGSTPTASLVEGLSDERGQPTQSSELTAWRPAVEEEIVLSSAVDGIVVRPTLVYGGAGGLFGSIFEAATKAGETGGKFEWTGEEGARWSLIHVDVSTSKLYQLCVRGEKADLDFWFRFHQDVADLVRRVAEAVRHLSFLCLLPRYQQTVSNAEHYLLCTQSPILAHLVIGSSPQFVPSLFFLGSN